MRAFLHTFLGQPIVHMVLLSNTWFCKSIDGVSTQGLKKKLFMKLTTFTHLSRAHLWKNDYFYCLLTIQNGYNTHSSRAHPISKIILWLSMILPNALLEHTSPMCSFYTRTWSRGLFLHLHLALLEGTHLINLAIILF